MAGRSIAVSMIQTRCFYPVRMHDGSTRSTTARQSMLLMTLRKVFFLFLLLRSISFVEYFVNPYLDPYSFKYRGSELSTADSFDWRWKRNIVGTVDWAGHALHQVELSGLAVLTSWVFSASMHIISRAKGAFYAMV